MHKKRKKIILGLIAFIGLTATVFVYKTVTVVYDHYVAAHYPMLVFELPVSECPDFARDGQMFLNIFSYFDKNGIKKSKQEGPFVYFSHEWRTGRVLGIRGYKIVRLDNDTIDKEKTDEGMVYFYIYNERFENLLMVNSK